jgi:DNA-binding response OmpR family regulator
MNTAERVEPGQQSSDAARPRRILVVEDEPMVAEVVVRYLRRERYDVEIAHDGETALALFESAPADLVVLDLMLPGVDGMEVCRRLRARGETPIIMLTARGEEVDKLLGLGAGADDYITKPFSPRELTARVQAVLRRASRAQAVEGDALRFRDLRIDLASRSVETAAGTVALTAKEFDLLAHLARHPQRVFTREQLMNSVWDYEFAGDASTVTVHMRRLRAKVEADPSRPQHLKTVWGVGYKFEP